MSDDDQHIVVTYSARDIVVLNLVVWPFWAKLLAIIGALLILVPMLLRLLDDYPISDAILDIDWTFTAEVLVVLALWIVLVIAVAFWRQRRKGVLGPIEFVLTADGVSFHNRQMKGIVFWSAIERLKLRRGRLFLFMTQRSGLILPRRAFASDAEFEGFVAKAEQRWKVHHRL